MNTVEWVIIGTANIFLARTWTKIKKEKKILISKNYITVFHVNIRNKIIIHYIRYIMPISYISDFIL